VETPAGDLPGGSVFSARSLVFSVLCAAVSVWCLRTGFLSFLFLFPLGLAAFFWGAKAAWAAGILAAAGNIILSLWVYFYQNAEPALLRWNAQYYTVMVLAFSWINAPLNRGGIMMGGVYRIAGGAVCCALLISPIFLSLMADPQTGAFVSRHIASFGFSGSPGAAGAVDFTPEEIIASLVYAGLRGGILVSCAFFLALSRQLAWGIARLVRRTLPAKPEEFHAHPLLIWALSLALGAVLLGRMRELDTLEITGWNVLVLSGILYLVQGGSIAVHYLVKAPPLPRVLINLGLILLFFTPGINAALLGILALLGIAENWVPFRAPKPGPPPTPEA
jgi:hypothetical protein